MNVTSVQVALESIERAHELDFDGGYGLAEALVRLSKEGTPADREWLKQRFISQVESGERWGLLLEVLTEGWGRDISSQLKRLLKKEEGSEAMRFEILRSLLRVGCAEIVDDAIRMIEDGLRRDSYDAVRALASLCYADPARAIDKYADFLSENVERLSRFVAMFVANMASCDPQLLAAVARKCRAYNHVAGMQVAEALANEINSRWYREMLGAAEVASIVESLGRT